MVDENFYFGSPVEKRCIYIIISTFTYGLTVSEGGQKRSSPEPTSQRKKANIKKTARKPDRPKGKLWKLVIDKGKRDLRKWKQTTLKFPIGEWLLGWFFLQNVLLILSTK